MENIKIGIVIQGSLVSQGIDCVNNCNELVDIYSKSPFVSKTVLSTWEGEDTELIDKRAIVLKSRPVVGEDIRNRQKQFLSTFEGVKFLKNNSDVTHILKLRTDQFVPIEIIDEIVLIYKKDQYDCKFFSQPLTFCYINRTIPFHIGDFFFAGKVSDMYKFLFNILSFESFNFQGAVEVDVVLKHLYKEDINFPIPFYILYKQMCIARQFSQNHLVWQYWRDIYKSDFYTFPKSIFEATNWKGLQWIDEANRRYLYGNGTRATETFHNFFDFSKESDLLKSNEQKYLKLPIDIQYHRVRYIKDFLAFVKLFSSTLFNKCVSFTAQKADSMVINIKKTLKPYIKRVIKK